MEKMGINGIEIKHLLTMSLQNGHKRQVKNGKRKSNCWYTWEIME